MPLMRLSRYTLLGRLAVKNGRLETAIRKAIADLNHLPEGSTGQLVRDDLLRSLEGGTEAMTKGYMGDQMMAIKITSFLPSDSHWRIPDFKERITREQLRYHLLTNAAPIIAGELRQWKHRHLGAGIYELWIDASTPSNEPLELTIERLTAEVERLKMELSAERHRSDEWKKVALLLNVKVTQQES